jgi:phosphotransferase system enzyme I (PtsP)
MQFFYAVDRGNSRVSNRFDALSTPVLRALRDIAERGHAHKKPVTLCGELASKPIGALALIALGYRSLSLSPSAVGPVKALILDLDVEKAHKLLAPLIASPTGSVDVREKIEAFAAAEGLALGS